MEPVSLILDIPEDGVRKEVENVEKTSGDELLDETTLGNKSEAVIRTTAATRAEKNFIPLFLQLFQKRTRTLKSTQVRANTTTGRHRRVICHLSFHNFNFRSLVPCRGRRTFDELVKDA